MQKMEDYGGNNNATDSSMFPPNRISTPSDCSFDDDVTDENRRALLILEYQQLYDRYTMCLSHLQESLEELDSLREENHNLQVANADLVQRLSLLSPSTNRNRLVSSGPPPPPLLSIMKDFNRLSLGEVSNVSPTSVIEHDRVNSRTVQKVELPKSISVRSSGYLNLSQRGNGGPNFANLVGSQRVCVPGGKREEEALEFDVYNQGMMKTELCNKWQETGKCPYGENCQFAHGIGELRPVIRHPRYKTEVCRLILTGGTCPYGHRCHFRHSLTDQEKLLISPLRLNDLSGRDVHA